MWLFLRARFETSVRGAGFLTSTLRQLGQLKKARTFGRTVDKLDNSSRHKRSLTKGLRIRDGGKKRGKLKPYPILLASVRQLKLLIT